MTKLTQKQFDTVLKAIEDAETFFGNFAENQADDRRRARMSRAKEILLTAWADQIKTAGDKALDETLSIICQAPGRPLRAYVPRAVAESLDKALEARGALVRTKEGYAILRGIPIIPDHGSREIMVVSE